MRNRLALMILDVRRHRLLAVLALLIIGCMDIIFHQGQCCTHSAANFCGCIAPALKEE